MFAELNDNVLKSRQMSLTNQGQAMAAQTELSMSSGSKLIISDLCYFSQGGYMVNNL